MSDLLDLPFGSVIKGERGELLMILGHFNQRSNVFVLRGDLRHDVFGYETGTLRSVDLIRWSYQIIEESK